MPGRLAITRNAQIFHPIRPLDAAAVQDILDSASSGMPNGEEVELTSIRAERRYPRSEESYRFSVRVFPTERPVYFFDSELKDKIHAFILLLEIDGYVALIRKGCGNLTDVIDRYFYKVDHSDLISGFGDDEVEFQKISLRNMTIAERALRARSYEAVDLKGVLSTYAAGRSIPYFIRIRQDGRLKSISTSASRVVENSDRMGIDDIALWVREQVRAIENPAANKQFLGAFAKPVFLIDVVAAATPSSLLFEVGALFERVQEEGLALLFKTKSGELVELDARFSNWLYRKLEIIYEIRGDRVISGFYESDKIKINEKSITFDSKYLRRFFVREDESNSSLQSYIVRNGLYSICFSDPKYMYFSGQCYQDVSAVSSISQLLDVFIPKAEIGGVVSEKGGLTSRQSSFDADSMFGVVENMHRNDDYIYCDDLGDEWADHISFSEADSRISFVHSKHGSVSVSASNMHDVVGQAIKNIGNMYFTRDSFIGSKSASFGKRYKRGVVSSIIRLRKGSRRQLPGYLDRLLANPKLHRECVLSCSFLSKAAVSAQFSRLNAPAGAPGHVVQLLWIISSFVHSAREAGVVPRIYCAP